MIADVIRTCLGPRSMLKMLMDPMGGVVMTKDGNAILREITVQHPAAKHMIEIARTQDEEVGDGTSSVVILAGEMLAVAEQYLEQNMHLLIIIQAYRQALDHALEALKDTLRYLGSWATLRGLWEGWGGMERGCWRGKLQDTPADPLELPQIPGGAIEESCVLDGIMINKDVTHAKMSRKVDNPRIILLDCPLEYKKDESQTSVEMTAETDFTGLLQMEEEHVKELCADILALRSDVVITEKGVSDLAQHYLVKAGVTCLRRVKKSDNNRLARACGATICNHSEELKDSDVGTQAGLFKVKKIGDEYFTFITKCQDPKA
ncbi:hypothetical protein O3P69_002787 [Scylla paramamosain]|uniref:T-complex protein 1 subunit gamma n=1 Tax=Scylla paramamosain TaxID=85552 RepID=A0AAW0UMK1_SCYPA